MSSFFKKLEASVEKNNSLLCVGLDPDFERLPSLIKKKRFPQFTFNKSIIDATHDLVCAFKPNSAFYEARGSEGIYELKKTCDYLHQKYPKIPIILDFKRGDIGSTNEAYVQYAFDYLGVDAITLQPYQGGKALQPFLDRKEKGCIILCKTSNPGTEEFQDLVVGRESLYKKVARKVVTKWNTNGNCLLVVGATYPKELKEIRNIAGDMTFLVPGVGAQGGDVKAMIQAGINSYGKGLIINASRSIIFTSSGKDFAKKARQETIKLKNEINRYINNIGRS